MVVQYTEENMESQDDWLTIEETAKRLKVSPYTVRRDITRHKLPAIQIGNKWRISKSGLQAQAQAHLNTEHAQHDQLE